MILVKILPIHDVSVLFFWRVIMCPCGIVYSLKCNLWAESPFADLLFSWKHLPNIIIYDFARGLATHANLRAPESIPVRPYEGRLAEPTEENIKLAKPGHLKVSLPWLEEKKSVSDPQRHPLTGSSEHYAHYICLKLKHIWVCIYSVTYNTFIKKY